MNCLDAFNILEIDKNIKLSNIDGDFLKKKYHKLALLHHPDKNGNTKESTEKFQQIQDAYNFLQREIRTNNVDNKGSQYKNTDIYADILQLFMKTVFDGNYEDVIVTIVKDIVLGCKKISVQLFDNLDKETIIRIYEFLSNNRLVLHLSNNILNELREMVCKKYDNVTIYKLNPSINDLLDHNLYKLYIKEQLFLVPLWYGESYYDLSGCEMIVICEPELDENMFIDDDNNIHFALNICATELPAIILNNKPIIFSIGKKVIEIQAEKLLLKREQQHRIKSNGISKITNNMYDISELSDLIVKITIS
uniref:J domain-containing protein n=1 Tax=viral metagenome TaxID=1070528 RepID=A0A6C0LM26_9ZZZZ